MVRVVGEGKVIWKGCLGTVVWGNDLWLVGLQRTLVGGWLLVGEEGFKKNRWETVFK